MDPLEDTIAASKDGANSQGVYIYRPTDSSKAHGERPAKRRKVLSSEQEPERNARIFAPLLNGDEKPESIDLRYKAFQQLWGAQEAKIQVSTHNPYLP
ncbi:Origin recognition complex subunit 3 [Aspergillus melleus]|uniref:Origin recognition complex subunit 3 n=1 Tax=Aspergillus melleus TaxID=138277 RepID=UPI001E8DC4A2|nr:Origin recognition complex subunit 3 [Aspergillus melleus]KAH8433640.1 Origin recognition complex subunit 3 [Aspergillus melleus]